MAKRSKPKRSPKKNRRFIFPFVLLAIALIAGFLFFSRPPETPQLVLYFFRGATLESVKRPLETPPGPSDAIRAVLAGPNVHEIDEGFTTQIPKDVRLLSFSVQNGVASVNLSAGLASYGGGAAKVQGLLAQIVYTATEFPQIQKVRLLVNGSGDVVLGGEGLVIDKPLGRMDVKL